MTEIEHMISRVVVCEQTGARSLSWRGCYFDGAKQVAYMHIGALHSGSLAAITASSPDGMTLEQWASACLSLMSMFPVLVATAEPFELHTIGDPDAYVIALDAYEANKL